MGKDGMRKAVDPSVGPIKNTLLLTTVRKRIVGGVHITRGPKAQPERQEDPVEENDPASEQAAEMNGAVPMRYDDCGQAQVITDQIQRLAPARPLRVHTAPQIAVGNAGCFQHRRRVAV